MVVIWLKVKSLYLNNIKPYLPLEIQKIISNMNGWMKWLRVQSWVTWILGPEYYRNLSMIEIDITYACNLRCYNCNRSCTQAPTGERMTVDQIKKFVEESKASNLQWKRIRILGGEPTLHPDFFEFIEILRGWRTTYSPNTLIEVDTNGHGKEVCKVLAQVPDDIIIRNTEKKDNKPLFYAFNVAPVDLLAYRWADYRNGCFVTRECGIGLTPNGYYQCAVAGGIDRIFGFGIGRDKIPAQDDNMEDQLERLCRYCGCFERRKLKRVNQTVMSKTWKTIYQQYNNNYSKFPDFKMKV